MPRKIPQWLPTLVWVIGIFFTAFFTGELIALYYRSKMSVSRDLIIVRNEVKETAPQKTIADYEKDVTPMFGEAKAPKSSAPSKTTKKEGETEDPRSQINWDQALSTDGQIQLKGTVIGSDTGIAFLSVGGVDVSLQIGQEVGSYKVDRILKNAVCFKNGGQEKLVAMNLEGVLPASIQSKPKPIPETAQKPETNPAEENLVTKSGDKYIVDRKGFNDLIKPPSPLANDLKFIPNAKDGKAYGIKISYLKKGSFFTKLGLQSGDIIVKANNKEIKSVEDSFDMYQMFKNEDHLTIQVDRDGQLQNIPIEFR